jgi:hypothetical protein
MKPLFRCEYCNKTGIEEEIAKHEEECFYNYNKHSCTTCKRAQIKGLKYSCAGGKDIPEGKMFIGCDLYIWDGEDHSKVDSSSVFGNLFGGLF